MKASWTEGTGSVGCLPSLTAGKFSSYSSDGKYICSPSQLHC
jgi:hypothetical protein